jgi:hypothetical protein
MTGAVARDPICRRRRFQSESLSYASAGSWRIGWAIAISADIGIDAPNFDGRGNYEI